MIKMAVFVSGEGTNMENLIRFFQKRDTARVGLVVSDRASAKALEKARALGVESIFVPAGDFENGTLLRILKTHGIGLIILAGFLKLIPEDLIDAYPERIINIHPALLPRFGGKGMYGMKVHQAVSQAGESKTGISIHFVNKHFDEGELIAQKQIQIAPGLDALKIMEAVRKLEFEFYPSVIEQVVIKMEQQDSK